MSANTTPDNIVYPVSTDQIAPLETVLATMASSMQTALSSQGKYFAAAVASAAARDSLFPQAKQGDRVYRTDLGYEEAFFGLYNAASNPGGRTTAGWSAPRDKILGGSIVPVSGFTIGVETFVRKDNNDMIEVFGSITRSGSALPSGVPVAIVAAGFRPVYAVDVGGTTSAGGSAGPAFVQVQPNGNILVYGPGAANTKMTFYARYMGA
jgi:hypothetical protein